MDLSKIEYFQFDNLIKNRVPFTLVNMGVDLSTFYTDIYAKQLQACEIFVKTPTEVESALIEKPFAKEQAVVVICDDGVTSEKLAADLVNQGFSNVYSVQGGFKKLLQQQTTL